MKNVRFIVWFVLILLVAIHTTRQNDSPAPAKSSESTAYTFPRTEIDISSQPVKNPTPATTPVQNLPEEEGCIDCGAAENIYDGYCYYCHPDFLFLCDRCGYDMPYHRTADNLCYECSEAVRNGAPRNIGRVKVRLETCMICGEAEGEYDGYCYYCHPDFMFLCKQCGGLWPTHRTASGLCDYCENPS